MNEQQTDTIRQIRAIRRALHEQVEQLTKTLEDYSYHVFGEILQRCKVTRMADREIVPIDQLPCGLVSQFHTRLMVGDVDVMDNAWIEEIDGYIFSMEMT